MEQTPADMFFIHNITEGDTELERELLRLYFDTAERCLRVMEESILSDPENRWPEAAHELKGASANLGAYRLVNSCAKAEDSGKIMDARPKLYQDTVQAYEAVKTYLLTHMR